MFTLPVVPLVGLIRNPSQQYQSARDIPPVHGYSTVLLLRHSRLVIPVRTMFLGGGREEDKLGVEYVF